MALRYILVPDNIGEQVVLGAGLLIANDSDNLNAVAFSVRETPSQILGLTQEGINFSAVPTMNSFVTELQARPEWRYTRVEGYAVTMTGVFESMTSRLVDLLSDVTQSITLWWIGDYGADGEKTMVIRMKNAHSTGGFSMQSATTAPAGFPFTFTAYYDDIGEGDMPFKVNII